jgi:hypothetical protein
MKSINNYINTAISDAKTVFPALKQATSKLSIQYAESTHPKLRILDNLIMICLLSFVLQIVYMIVGGTKEPLNALLAGCFCSLGQFALAGKFLVNNFYILLASLRIQLSDSQYENYSNKKSIIEFLIASFLLYLSCFCLIN